MPPADVDGASGAVADARRTGAAAADDNWRARYFNNTNLTGAPVWQRDESKIDNDWGGGSP